MSTLDEIARTFQQRIYEINTQIHEQNLLKAQAEREAAELTRDAARIGLESLKARLTIEKLECEERLKSAQTAAQNYREWQRPSRQYGVEIRQLPSGQWEMELGGVKAIGDTPAIAAAEFDHAWVFGDEHD